MFIESDFDFFGGLIVISLPLVAHCRSDWRGDFLTGDCSSTWTTMFFTCGSMCARELEQFQDRENAFSRGKLNFNEEQILTSNWFDNLTFSRFFVVILSIERVPLRKRGESKRIRMLSIVSPELTRGVTVLRGLRLAERGSSFQKVFWGALQGALCGKDYWSEES